MIKGILSFFSGYEGSEYDVKESGIKTHLENFAKTESFTPVLSRWADIYNGVMLEHNIKAPKLNIFVGTRYNLMQDTKNGGYYPFILISEKPKDLRMLIFQSIKEQQLFCIDMLREELNFDKYMANSIKEGRMKMFRFKHDGDYYTAHPNIYLTQIYNIDNPFLEYLFGNIPFSAHKPEGTELHIHNYFLLSTIKEENYYNYDILQKPKWIVDYEKKLNGEN
jgi:hypothetical protein|nr:MAG TPA: hypothetical protein [Caudoviricetes sp.]